MNSCASTPLLSVQRVSLAIAGTKILEHVSLCVRAGEQVGLVGPNGAGKTSVLNVVSGLVRPQQGEVRLKGESLLALRPPEIAKAGVGRVFQTSQQIQRLSVREYLAVGRCSRLPIHQRFLPAGRNEDELPYSNLFADGGLHITDVLHHQIGSLPYAHRRYLEFVQALLTSPSLLLIDELGAGLGKAERAAIGQALVTIRSAGIGVLLIEHDVSFLRRSTDRCVFLSAGKVEAEGPSADVLSGKEFEQIYVGS